MSTKPARRRENKEEYEWVELKPEEYEENEYIVDDEDTMKKEFYVIAKQRWKSVAAAVILFLVGWTFTILAIYSIYLGDWWYAFPCMVLAFIGTVPGSK